MMSFYSRFLLPLRLISLIGTGADRVDETK